MNNHLNLFRFYNESEEKKTIENNLSRAFSICLINNSLFFNEYVKTIISDEDYNYLFGTVTSDSRYHIDIQIDTATIEKESFRVVYAVAMTSDKDLRMDDFFSHNVYSGKKNISDILIVIKDIAIIIEVKRSSENCNEQLYNQVFPFLQEPGKYQVKPVNCSWPEVVRILEKVKNIQTLVSQSSLFINDFLSLFESRYPDWFEPKPFNIIPFLTENNVPDRTKLLKRMRQALARVSTIAGNEYQLLLYNDRLSVSVPFGWAGEINPDFKYYHDDVKEYVVFYFWPGNTKQQGYSIFTSPLDWTKKETLNVNGKDYGLEIVYNIKLCHFNRFVSGINYHENDLLKPIHTYENYNEKSGKWNYESWNDFEKFLDDHFTPEFNWRDKCKWEDNFVNTDRSYFTMSLGFEVVLFVPYSEFKVIDKKNEDIMMVTKFVFDIIKTIGTLI